MKSLKKIIALMLALTLILAFASCGKTEDANETTIPETASQPTAKTKVAVLNGPTGLGLSKFKADRSYAFDVEYYSDPQAIVPLIVNGEADIATVPLNLAANIYKKTKGEIQMIAINTLGVLHILSTDESIKSVADLKGKTVYATGQGATPEYILNYILKKNNIDPEKDIDIQYKSAHNELATLAIEGKVDICVLPEPFAANVTFKNQKMKYAIDLTEEWSKVSDAELSMGCYIARKSFIENNPDALAMFFEYGEISVNYVNNYTSSYQFLIDEGYFDKVTVATNAVIGSNMVFITGERMKAIAKENFEVLFNADPTSVGGEIPNENLYYIEK